MPRLFIGIKITPANSLENIFYNLKKDLSQSNIKWVDPQNFHLTLKFLGDVKENYINSLVMLLEQIACNSQIFNLESTEIGYFGRTKHPRVIWYGFNSNDRLLNLQSSIDESLAELGFDKEKKSYSPHLTLGRIKNIVPNNDLKKLLSTLDPLPEIYPITGFSLIESNLKKEGPEYKVLRHFNLKKN
jgi:RNA 2',3'-cyclic 3'-phosphodiesterase